MICNVEAGISLKQIGSSELKTNMSTIINFSDLEHQD